MHAPAFEDRRDALGRCGAIAVALGPGRSHLGVDLGVVRPQP
ncbi:MAG: twin-arginine translocation signal domain-containing protein [Acidiferrobacteraceae bacterium]